METEQCRMCGKTLVLSDLLKITEELQRMIELHCRFELDLSDNQFPKKLCYDCNYTIENFARFSDDARVQQLKFSAIFREIKIEIDELPTLVQDSKLGMFVDEPKVETNENSESDEEESIDTKPARRKKRNADQLDEDDSKNAEGSDFDSDSSESDSDYEGNKYYKRKKPVKHRRVRVKRKKLSTKTEQDEENEILQDVPENDRYKNGSIKKKSLSLYEGKTWNDLKVGCVECDQFTNGPFELRQHHFKFHSLDSQFRCAECAHQNDVNFSYFYQFLNHYPEHQLHLKFCCVSYNPY